MTNDKCPRCSHEGENQDYHDWTAAFYGCGSYREPSGNFYESELCETRQELAAEKAKNIYLLTAMADDAEKAEAELMECARAIEIKDRDGMAAYNRANKAESELAAEKAKNIYLLTAMADDAEKHEAELAEAINQRDKAHSSMIAYEAAAHRTAYAEAKLAKREKALEQAVRHISCFCAPMAEEHTATALAYDLIRRCADESPELAEWLKQRGEK